MLVTKSMKSFVFLDKAHKKSLKIPTNNSIKIKKALRLNLRQVMQFLYGANIKLSTDIKGELIKTESYKMFKRKSEYYKDVNSLQIDSDSM